MVDIKAFEESIYSRLDSILDENYAGDMQVIPECRLIYKETGHDSRTGEPYYLFSTTVLEYQEDLVPNPKYDLDNEPEFIDQGESVPVLISIGIDNNFKIVEALIDE